MREIQIVWTVVAAILIVGIGAWAWSGKRKKDFEEASRLPLEEDDELIPPPPGKSESK